MMRVFGIFAAILLSLSAGGLLNGETSQGKGERTQGVAFHYIQTQADWEQALRLAREEKKPVFVDAFTTWCPPCKALDRYVFSEDSVGSVLNSDFVALKIDLEKGFGVEFAERFQIEAFPTLLVLNEAGDERQRWIGFRQATDLLKELEPFRG